jgi:hypothetical protein
MRINRPAHAYVANARSIFHFTLIVAMHGQIDASIREL